MNDSGKVSVGEVRQNDSTFQMNTSSKKVLREVLSGILITEPNMRISKIRRRRAPKRRGFWDKVDLRFGAIDMTNVNRKRGRERETIRKVPKQFKYNKYIEKRVRMHGECMNMWYAKEIASWAQPNPILPAHNQFAQI